MYIGNETQSFYCEFISRFLSLIELSGLVHQLEWWIKKNENIYSIHLTSFLEKGKEEKVYDSTNHT